MQLSTLGETRKKNFRDHQSNPFLLPPTLLAAVAAAAAAAAARLECCRKLQRFNQPSSLSPPSTSLFLFLPSLAFVVCSGGKVDVQQI